MQKMGEDAVEKDKQRGIENLNDAVIEEKQVGIENLTDAAQRDKQGGIENIENAVEKDKQRGHENLESYGGNDKQRDIENLDNSQFKVNANSQMQDYKKEVENDKVNLQTALDYTGHNSLGHSDVENVEVRINANIGEPSGGTLKSLSLKCHKKHRKSDEVIVKQNDRIEKSDEIIVKQNDSSETSDIVLQSKESLQYWVKEFSSILIAHLNKFGVCVIDNFIGDSRGTKILNEVLELQQTAPFTVGTLSQDLSNPSVRSDTITWVDAVNPPCPSIRSLLNLLDAIVLMANKTPNNGELGNFRIKGRTKAMVACYPGRGSHYVKHVDNPNKDGRCITAIYYLNKNWIKEYGGTLMLYPSKPVGAVASVEPVFDRVIFFWSDRRNPHQVLPTHRPRYAITAWYFDSEEKNAYMKRQEALSQK